MKDELNSFDWSRIERDRDISLQQQVSARRPDDELRRTVAEHVMNDLFSFLRHPLFDRNEEPERLHKQRRPLSRREAYLWLVERAVKRDGLNREGYRVSRSFVFPIGRGEFCRAECEMGEAFNWSRKALRTFLETLEQVGELKKITPVGMTQQRLAALRVPSAYAIARVVGWYIATDAGIVEGVEVVADTLDEFDGQSEGDTAGDRGDSKGDTASKSDSKSDTRNRPIYFNDLAKGDSKGDSVSKGDTKSDSKGDRGDTKGDTAGLSEHGPTLLKGHAWGHAQDGKNSTKSKENSSELHVKGPRLGPTKEWGDAQLPNPATFTSPAGLSRRAYRKARAVFVPVPLSRSRKGS